MPSEGALAIECASGLTASVLALALEVLGRDAVLYDKSNWRRRRLEGERKAGAPECLVEPACSAGIGGALGVNSGSVRNGRHLSLSDCLGEEASALCSLESKWTYEEVCALVEEWNDLLDEWLPHLALAHAKSFRDCLRAIGLHLASLLESAREDLLGNPTQRLTYALPAHGLMSNAGCMGLHVRLNEALRGSMIERHELPAEFRLSDVLPAFPGVLSSTRRFGRNAPAIDGVFSISDGSLLLARTRRVETLPSTTTAGSFALLRAGAGGAVTVLTFARLLTLGWKRTRATGPVRMHKPII